MHHLPATAATQLAAFHAAHAAADRDAARLGFSLRERRQRNIVPGWRITSPGARIDLAPELRRLPRTRVHLHGRPWPAAGLVIDHARAMIIAAAIAARCELAGDDVMPDDQANDPCAVAATGAAAITTTGPPDAGSADPDDPEHALVACRRVVHLALAPRRFAVALRAALPARGHVCLDV